jgi:putative oxidoreductase
MRSVGLLILRIIAGGLFMAHGYAKLFGGKGRPAHPAVQRYLGEGFVSAMERGGVANFSGGLQRMGVPAPRMMAGVVAATEFFGGLMLIGGVFTRLAAFALAINMVMAIKLAHWKQGLIGSASGYMYALSMLGAVLGLLSNGPGSLSLDGSPERWFTLAANSIRRSGHSAPTAAERDMHGDDRPEAPAAPALRPAKGA